MVEENVGLKSEIEALEAEISEVQDTFREKDAKEFKRVKWELGKSRGIAQSFATNTWQNCVQIEFSHLKSYN